MMGPYERGLGQKYAAVHERLWPTPPPVCIAVPPRKAEPEPEPPPPPPPPPQPPKALRKLGEPIKIGTVIRAAARHYDIDPQLLIGRSRLMPLVRWRQIAMFLSLKWAHGSLPQVGRHFGGRDHTTVMHARNQITDLLATNDTVRSDVAAIESLLDISEIIDVPAFLPVREGVE